MASSTQFPTLATVLEYHNQDVLDRYHQDFPDNQLSAEDAFQETLKFLWCANKLKRDRVQNPENPDLAFKFYLHYEMKEIDDMWHTFILFTREYMDFGKQYFGHYLHHAPTTQVEKAEQIANFEENLNGETTKQLSYVYDNLGAETLKIWFADYFTGIDTKK